MSFQSEETMETSNLLQVPPLIYSKEETNRRLRTPLGDFEDTIWENTRTTNEDTI